MALRSLAIWRLNARYEIWYLELEWLRKLHNSTCMFDNIDFWWDLDGYSEVLVFVLFLSSINPFTRAWIEDNSRYLKPCIVYLIGSKAISSRELRENIILFIASFSSIQIQLKTNLIIYTIYYCWYNSNYTLILKHWKNF